MSESEETELYCICRSNDVKRFMIGCDHCEDWFHGRCIQVTEKEAKYIKKFFCPECRKKNPALKVVYKSKYLEKYPEKAHSPPAASTASGPKPPRERPADEERRPKERQRPPSVEERRPASETLAPDQPLASETPRAPSPDQARSEEEKRAKDRREAERQAERQAAREREREREKRQEKERERRQAKDQRRAEERAQRRAAEQKRAKAEAPSAPVGPVKREPIEVSPTSDVQAPLKREHPAEDPARAPPIKKERKEVRLPTSHSDSEGWEPPAIPAKSKRDKPPSKKKAKPLAAVKPKKRRGRRNYYESSSEGEMEIDLTPKQCSEPNCNKTARYGSKYCSDKCGLGLATRRIYQTLPDRIREWNLTPCEAETKDRKRLESIRSKQNDVKNRMEQLNREFKMLEEVIAKGKTLSIEENEDDSDDDTIEATVHCVTCGASIQVNSAMRHMEKCYNKIESKTSFASKFKTQIEDHRMFCDFFNPKEQTYCKRLQVLCPEHNPDSKVADDEVCGYPLQKQLFGKPFAFCLKPKKTCHQHYCWEKLRRAELDMDRVKMWMKVDELLEQERQVKSAMASRAGVIGLMLHSTFNHELDGRWQAQRAAAHQRKVQATQMKHNQKPAK